jgi:hypothetical protein
VLNFPSADRSADCLPGRTALQWRMPALTRRRSSAPRRRAAAVRGVSWLISPKTRGTFHLNSEGESERTIRETKTFPNEREAKKFAIAKLADTLKVSAGTLNPQLPKRTIAPKQILEWLDEPDGPDAAP